MKNNASTDYNTYNSLIKPWYLEIFLTWWCDKNFAFFFFGICNTYNSLIKPSTYETNSFLYDKDVSMIQYAAFFGSIQIFKYLFVNYAQYDSSLWLFAIYGNNSEIIHHLEENK